MGRGTVLLDNLSYLAGIIDGEGSLGFFSAGVGKKRFVIEVAMTCESIIDWLQANYGGSKTLLKVRKPHYKQQWKWIIKDSKAKNLYLEVKPLLKLKNHIEL